MLVVADTKPVSDHPGPHSQSHNGTCRPRAVSPQIADVLRGLPERVRITWPHHRLVGAELAVHGWRQVGGEVHLPVMLLDGTTGCLPLAWTELAPAVPGRGVVLTVEAVRALRGQLEALANRAGELRDRCPTGN
jgi:hypothetical protein